MMNKPLHAYRQTRVKTAGPGRLIVMLYDEGVKQLDLAIGGLSSDSPKLDDIHNAIVKAQDIITELMVSLDFDKGGDIATNLFHLYMYFNQRLIDANLTKDAAGLQEVRNLFADLRGAWASIENTAAQDNSGMSGVNLAG